MLSALFGEPPTARDQMKQHRRTIDKAIRNLERERIQASAAEKNKLNMVRVAAGKGDVEQARRLAKETVRARRQAQQLETTKERLRGLSTRMQSMAATQTLGTTMQGVTKAVKAMSEDVGIAAVAQTMRTFEREMAVLTMSDDLLGETLEEVLDAEEDDDGANDLVEQLLAEKQESMELTLPAVPVSRLQTNPPYDQMGGGSGALEMASEQNDLQCRLDDLRLK